MMIMTVVLVLLLVKTMRTMTMMLMLQKQCCMLHGTGRERKGWGLHCKRKAASCISGPGAC